MQSRKLNGEMEQESELVSEWLSWTAFLEHRSQYKPQVL